MRPGDLVETPMGIGTIVDVRNHGQWIFGRYRPEVLLIIRYPSGKRHAWVAGKVKRYKPPNEVRSET